MEVSIQCSLFELNGQYYSTCYFSTEVENFDNKELMLRECELCYENPSQYIVHVSREGFSYLILPKA